MEEGQIIPNDTEQNILPQNQKKQLTKRERKLLKKQKLDNIALEQKKQSQKKSFLWLFVVILIGGSILGIGWLSQSKSNQTPLPLIDKISSNDHIKGSPDAKNILVEYSDFQCPACRQYYLLLKRVSEELGNKVQIVYRNFPLTSIHRNASLAARAAEAAGVQGKFWEMHDQIFENQSSWSESTNPRSLFNSYAENIGLNLEQFKQDIESSQVKDKVNKDYNSGIQAGVPGTPTFFLNGEKINTPRSYDEFRSILE